MSGEKDLQILLKSLSATLHDGVYVFANVENREVRPDLSPRMVFQETEGKTLVLLKAEADYAGLPYEYPCRMITLNIHSSLEAVGFLATITTALADKGISVNPVSAFFHDHLFVPQDRTDETMRILAQIAAD